MEEATALLSAEVGPKRYYRLLGIGVDALRPADSLALLDLMNDEAHKQNSLEQALDQLYNRHGDKAVISGRRFQQNYDDKDRQKKPKRPKDG